MNIANKVSAFRILSVPFFVATLLYYTPDKEYLRLIALGIFILAAFSDFIDGYIARKNRQYTPAGSILDPLGDKLLLVTAFVSLYFIDTGIRFPLWVILIVVSRDVIIVLGIVVIFLVRQRLDLKPSPWGKLTTAFQMLSVISLLLRAPFCYIIWWLAVVFTLVSGIQYVRRGFKILYSANENIK